jgi:pilus assembly protein CpaE
MMFSKPLKTTEQRLHVTLAGTDAEFLRRAEGALASVSRYHVEKVEGSLARLADTRSAGHVTSLLIAELAADRPDDLLGLGRLLHRATTPPAVVVVGDGLAEPSARALLKLQIADWLPKGCSAHELLQACEQALRPASSPAVHRAACTAFIPAIGGAGATTLALSAIGAMCGKGRTQPAACCYVDLNLQAGAAADYLDLAPSLDLGEIAASPQRLDGHLLEVMLTRHRSGFALLAAPPSLRPALDLDPEVVGRLLDLASSKFDRIVIDMPSLWLPWCEAVVRGADRVFIVSDMSVVGLRQARRLAELIGKASELSMQRSVLVNKCAWLGTAGVKKQHASEILGTYLAGFVPEAGAAVREAQNRGVLPAEAGRDKPIQAALRKILTQD